MDKQEIARLLAEMPLAKAVRHIMKDAVPASLRSQIQSLEKELEGPITGGMRTPLSEALAKMKEAERQAGLPLQTDIARAINAILSHEGLSVKKAQPAAGGPRAGGRRKRIDPAELRQKVLSVLPHNPAEGMPGQALAKECGVSYVTLRKNLVSFQDQGYLVREGTGNNTRWHRKS